MTIQATDVPEIAAPPPSLLGKGLASGKYRYEDGELHKRCGRCRDYWPADTEFFYSAKGTRNKDGLNDWCKACYTAWRYPNGRKSKNET
jgi:hypothetical protein